MKNAEFMLSLFFVFLLFGCGAKKVKEVESDKALYEAAMEELTEKDGGFPWIFSGTDYEKILKLLQEIQLRYTYSPYATLAELRTADAYFDQEEYEQAVIEYEEFLKRHPGHEEAPYATYRLALSHYKKMPSADRDPTHTRQAVRWFNLFIENYPTSPLASKAVKMRLKARKRLAEREIYIGKFYAKRDNYKAAAERFKIVVNQYDDTSKHEEALFLLGKSYLKMDQVALAKETLERVVEDFPEAEYHDDAAELLADIGDKEKKKAEK